MHQENKLLPNGNYKVTTTRSVDTGGLVFHFNRSDKHYKIRFAGKPIMLIEQLYYKMGGEHFRDTYNKLKNKQDVSNDNKIILEAAMRLTNTFLEALSDCEKSPIVVYISDNKKA